MSEPLKPPLKQRLLRHIADTGPITFADFMEAALYDSTDGFYAKPPVGPRGDFVTSPHVSRGFGALVEKQFFGMWWRLGRPKRFEVIEAGAGDGTLARTILEAARDDDAFDTELHYSAVEISKGARDAITKIGIPAFETLKNAPRIGNGCILANELFDNLPFHRVRLRDGALREVFVDVRDGRLVEIEGPATPEAAAATVRTPFEGETRVSPAASTFLREAIAHIGKGWILLYDYGHDEGDEPLPIRAYEAHRMHDALYEDPGSADITAGADFSAIAKTATEEGAIVFGPRSQRDVLNALGFKDWYATLRSARLKAEERRDSKAILSLVSEQSRAPLLTDPAHLGGLKVIAIGTGVDVPPPGFD
ncbi:MAG: SAM-dependent methyltransferase [Actinomycetota bacterium]